MLASTGDFDLQGVRALAHGLYCACQNPSSVYRPLAASVRALRNKLEEADEALDRTSARTENTNVLQAAIDSQVILGMLEQAIQQQYTMYTGSETSGSDTVASYHNEIDEVTGKLSHALEALGRLNRNASLISGTEMSESSHLPRTPSTMTSQSDEGNKLTTPASSLSSRSRPTSLSQRMSVNSDYARVLNIEDEKSGVLPYKTTQSPRAISTNFSKPRSPALPADPWTMSPEYFDPMAFDIDSASSLIMGHDMSKNEGKSQAMASFAELDGTKSETRDNLTGHENSMHHALTTSAGRAISTQRQVGTLDATMSPTSSVHAPEEQLTMEKNSRLSNRFSRRGAPAGPHTAISEHTAVATQHIIHSWREDIQEHEVSPSYHAVSSDHAIGNTKSPDLPQKSPLRQASQMRPQSLFRPHEVAQSRYRVVDPEMTSAISTTEPGKKPCNEGSRSAYFPAVQQEEESRPKTLATTQPLVMPTPPGPNTDQRHAFINYDHFDNETIKLIVRLWNETLWDQAKVHINRLANRHNSYYDRNASRRIQHLLGVLHSLQGELQQALKHFTAVFDQPLADARLLDVGHCAAAHWMGDIYALLNWKAEALLAYSVAARSPLLLDSRWLPLRECLRAELQACRKCVQHEHVDWDGEMLQHRAADGSAESLLDPRIMLRDAAKAVLESCIPPSRQGGSSNSEPTLVLPTDKNRATKLHDLGLLPAPSKPTQNQTKTTKPPTTLLHLSASAFDPTAPWPLLFEPFFCAPNVFQNRLSILPTPDLLLQNNPSLPKKTRLSFTCQDLPWLVQTLRKCLSKMNMQWTEVAGSEEETQSTPPKFLVRYHASSSAEGKSGIANVCFFSIPLYRLSFRPGFGVDLCPDGICCARVMEGPKLVEGQQQKSAGGGGGSGAGGNKEDVKRVRKRIKEFLEAAARRFEALEARNGNVAVLPVVSINGVTSLREMK